MKTCVARCVYFLFLIVIFLSGEVVANAALRVTSDFEGGSAQVLRLDQETQTVSISPAGNPERGMPNWWYLRLDDVDPTKPIILEIVAKEAMMQTDITGKIRSLAAYWAFPAQASFSTDGMEWEQ